MNNYTYSNTENYEPALSSCTTMGIAHDFQGYTQVMLRKGSGKSYVVVNPMDTSKVEKYGAFSIRAAVRPPYNGGGGIGCGNCGGNCGCNCGSGGQCNCRVRIMGVT